MMEIMDKDLEQQRQRCEDLRIQCLWEAPTSVFQLPIVVLKGEEVAIQNVEPSASGIPREENIAGCSGEMQIDDFQNQQYGTQE